MAWLERGGRLGETGSLKLLRPFASNAGGAARPGQTSDCTLHLTRARRTGPTASILPSRLRF